jgi:hypothetical protein
MYNGQNHVVREGAKSYVGSEDNRALEEGPDCEVSSLLLDSQSAIANLHHVHVTVTVEAVRVE